MIAEGMYVRVREDLCGDRRYGDTYCSHKMQKYRGKTFVVVTELYPGAFGLMYPGEFGLSGIREWVWSEEMLIPVAPPESVDVNVRLRADIFGLGASGDIVKAQKHRGFIYLGKEHLPMQGILSADEAEIIKEED